MTSAAAASEELICWAKSQNGPRAVFIGEHIRESMFRQGNSQSPFLLNQWLCHIKDTVAAGRFVSLEQLARVSSNWMPLRHELVRVFKVTEELAADCHSIGSTPLLQRTLMNHRLESAISAGEAGQLSLTHVPEEWSGKSPDWCTLSKAPARVWRECKPQDDFVCSVTDSGWSSRAIKWVRATVIFTAHGFSLAISSLLFQKLLSAVVRH